jgi:hypothetical protein
MAPGGREVRQMRETEVVTVPIGEFNEALQVERFVPVAATEEQPELPESFYLSVVGPKGGAKFCRFVGRSEHERLSDALDEVLASGEQATKARSGESVIDLMESLKVSVEAALQQKDAGKAGATDAEE